MDSSFIHVRTKCDHVTCEFRTYLTNANVVAPLVFNKGRVVIDIQDVDGERVVCVSGR